MNGPIAGLIGMAALAVAEGAAAQVAPSLNEQTLRSLDAVRTDRQVQALQRDVQAAQAVQGQLRTEQSLQRLQQQGAASQPLAPQTYYPGGTRPAPGAVPAPAAAPPIATPSTLPPSDARTRGNLPL